MQINLPQAVGIEPATYDRALVEQRATLTIGPPATLCDAFSSVEKASQSVGSWGCKTSLRGGRLVA